MMLLIKRLLGNKKLLFALAVLYSCVITVLFFISTSGLPRIRFSAIDKVVHVSVFFLLVCIWQLYAMRQNEGVLTWRNSFKILLWSLFYGIVIEVFQGVFTHVRSADVLDVVANLAGSLVGVVFFQKIKHIFTV